MESCCMNRASVAMRCTMMVNTMPTRIRCEVAVQMAVRDVSTEFSCMIVQLYTPGMRAELGCMKRASVTMRCMMMYTPMLTSIRYEVVAQVVTADVDTQLCCMDKAYAAISTELRCTIVAVIGMWTIPSYNMAKGDLPICSPSCY